MTELQARRTKTFVLVHGAWHGGWCWRRVADLLRAHGHKVFTPTLTGLGERSHLLHPGIDLSPHVTDVVNVIKWERLNDIVLVGHSYGGCVISGVAEQMPDAIGSIVFLDAFLPENGDAMARLCVAAGRAEVIRGALERGDTAVPVRDAAAFRVNEKDRAWVDSLAAPQPIGTMTEKIKLTGARDRIAKKTYIRAQAIPTCRSTRPTRASRPTALAHLRSAVRPRRHGRHAGPADGDPARGGVNFQHVG